MATPQPRTASLQLATELLLRSCADTARAIGAASLQGTCALGLCAEGFATWDGVWVAQAELAKHAAVWAVHDSFGERAADVSSQAFGRRRWHKEPGLDGVSAVGYGDFHHPTGHARPLPGFGNGDRIGFLVERVEPPADAEPAQEAGGACGQSPGAGGRGSPSGNKSPGSPKEDEDPRTRWPLTISLFKNGKRRGLLVSGLAAQALYPMATLPSAEVGASPPAPGTSALSALLSEAQRRSIAHRAELLAGRCRGGAGALAPQGNRASEGAEQRRGASRRRARHWGSGIRLGADSGARCAGRRG